MRSPSPRRLLLPHLRHARELIWVLLIPNLFLRFLQKEQLAISVFTCLFLSGTCSSEASLITSHLAFSQDPQLWWPIGLQNFTLLEVEQSAPIPGGVAGQEYSALCLHLVILALPAPKSVAYPCSSKHGTKLRGPLPLKSSNISAASTAALGLVVRYF